MPNYKSLEEECRMNLELPLFDNETWEQLPDFLEQLPEPVRLHIWGDIEASPAEREAERLAATLSERFETIGYKLLPRRINFNYYPVIGVMGVEGTEAVDYGVRIIGLPAGVQMTALIAGIQCVSFRGMTSEARTRIQLHRLQEEVALEIITDAGDEAGAAMAQIAFNIAVASQLVRCYLIMGDAFPDAIMRYSVKYLPHTVINGRVHVEGSLDEGALMKHIASALEAQPPAGPDSEQDRG
jgi:alkyl hydroperoxide reductase subunit AhpF